MYTEHKHWNGFICIFYYQVGSSSD